MKNNFRIDYDSKIISLHFQGEDFQFDLDDGDIGDMWNTFTDKNDVMRDINFSQEDETQKPSLSVYDLKEEPISVTQTVDLNSEEVIECSEQFGNPLNYFK